MSGEEKRSEQAEEPAKVDGVVILANDGRSYLKLDHSWGEWDSSPNGNSNKLRVWTVEQARKLYTESRGEGELGEDAWDVEPTEVLEATWEKGHKNEDDEDTGTTLSANRFPIFDYLRDHPDKVETT